MSDLLIAVCALLRSVLNFISSPLSDNTTTTSNSNSNSNSTEQNNTSAVGVGDNSNSQIVSYSQKILEGIYRTQLIGCLVQALQQQLPQSPSSPSHQQQQPLLTTKAAAAVVQVLSASLTHLISFFIPSLIPTLILVLPLSVLVIRCYPSWC